MKTLKLIIPLLFLGCIAVYSQDDDSNKEINIPKKKSGEKFFIRAGAGAHGMISFFYPNDINNYTREFYDHLMDQFIQIGFHTSSDSRVPKIFIGYGYSVKACLRIFNVFELEPYWDNFYAFPLNMKMDFFYNNYYNGEYGSYTATHKFQPVYEEKGLSLLFVPGSKTKRTFLTIGFGIGHLQGKLNKQTTGKQNINGVITDLANSESYAGSTTAYHGVIGITTAPWKFLELEFRWHGRYARIPCISNSKGSYLTINDKSVENVALDFSGIDFRFGINFIFP